MHRDHITAALPASLQDDGALSRRWPEAALPREWVSRILERMHSLYGERFVRLWSEFEAEALARRWAIELRHLSPDQLGRGMRALSTLDFPPTVPQFISLCRLNPRAAYYEALEGLLARERGALGEWSDPAIFWAAAAIGTHDLKAQTYRRIRARWQAALAAAQAAPRPDPIPAPAARSAAFDAARASAPIERKAPLATVRLPQAPAGPSDPKRWAKRILARRAAGDPSVTFYQVHCAQNALN